MRPVELALEILELIGRHQPVGVSQLSRLAALPKSTTQRSLKALAATGWIAAGDDALWSLTTRAMVACGRATRPQAALRGVALPVLEDLRRATGETIHLTWRHEDRLVLLERLDGLKPVRYFFPLGGLVPLHVAASGQAVLAALPPDELEAYLAGPLARFTPLTVTDPDALRLRAQQARFQGYAVSPGGNIADVNAVGAAIIEPLGRPIAAISVSAPAERLPPELADEYGPQVADAARRISLGLRA